ncbi:putative DNA-binding protein (MmcQ/YjbR family) [Ruminiclostridium sufflavum DSM 19573]|uniref:Putative DNA-binding protein (MmcQ/YjbR family) n=1 Tax=Ruminiclostridium sufflavum DSM 19573 TaxID=1121337 RepID=A0A318YC30_9FIRM|nr:MmcQ/YjbR family DNA-binding protein [Ruminiclostridium sufflavum]PYG90182.1 putative DNA-binding protein (MmcQ/YjbR family) [Ruminiclostridium sufflavum DSM 19573]
MKYLWLDEYLLSMKGALKDFKAEWGWTRYLIGNKMFAAVCKDAAGERDIITIKLNPLEGDFLRGQHKDIIPGHYMNKEHWSSIYLDGAIDDEMMKELTKKSYRLVLGGLSKKLQKEISEEG